MARASRSSKKQPEFHPSELEDLIFSPAVGKGVGSHLVTRAPVVTTDLTTVVTSELKDVSTVVASDMATVDMRHSVDVPDLPTVVMSPAVDTRDVATMVTSSQVAAASLTSPPPSQPPPATIPAFPSNRSSEPLLAPPQKEALWITDHGDLIPAGRVRRVRLAQDAVNSAEECVYDTLWNAKLIQADERESCRIVQAGYDYLVKRTRLSRKTIQRIVAKLIEKNFIAVETRADIYQRISTTYRVFSYKAVLDRNLQMGRQHVAKIGPGFAFCRPLTQAEQGNLTTVDMSATSNPDPNQDPDVLDMTTVAKPTTVTVANGNPTTVVKLSPYLLEKKNIDKTSSSAVREALMRYGFVDDDAVNQLIRTCRDIVPSYSDAEIVEAIHQKGNLMLKRRTQVHNPMGFLLTAVPRSLSPDNLPNLGQERQQGEESKQQRVSEEDAAALRWRKEQEKLLDDPEVSEQEKHLIRLCLGLNVS
jgi:predicted transcriptional regulator